MFTFKIPLHLQETSENNLRRRLLRCNTSCKCARDKTGEHSSFLRQGRFVGHLVGETKADCHLRSGKNRFTNRKNEFENSWAEMIRSFSQSAYRSEFYVRLIKLTFSNSIYGSSFNYE
ncbi:hypothetical protein CDAR_196261 [Caerostris darwini]|uniref:Uncharacterized protein n=1 Tax=Caerostris darwini TaxID=1538125 RepID=A0AAV4PWG7_9ARAC|nr:hypothetical protein CDAR_196261 [Caerostris darwini]